MTKIVLVGAGSGFGAISIVDLLSYEALRDCELVLVDINAAHLEPIAAYARKVSEHYGGATRVTTALDWRDGVLDGAKYVMTSFAQGGPAYDGVPFHHEVTIPRRYGIEQNIADTAGFGGVFRMMRTAPELVAIGHDMERRCPGAWLLNYVNPMAMLTRALTLSCPDIHVVGLCHNVQHAIRWLAGRLGCQHTDLRFTASGVNHMVWFTRLEYADGRNAYEDLPAAIEAKKDREWHQAIHHEVFKHFGCWTTESPGHLAEYLPYYLSRDAGREAIGELNRIEPRAEVRTSAPRFGEDSDVVKQLDGRLPLNLERSSEYGVRIVHGLETDTVERVHVNVLNDGMISNLPPGTCVEVPATADRAGVHRQHVGALPAHLAALCRGLADMQTLASDAFLERDLQKAFYACLLDPCTAASATPDRIRQCFSELLDADRAWLEPYWSEALGAWAPR